VFLLDSLHEGTVASINDKGAVITLAYGVEGFAPTRHLKKQDGANLKVEESAEFRVIEFSKSSKKIILSHAKVYEESVQAEKQEVADSTKKAIKKNNDSNEKSTLGDIAALSELKERSKND
jgi:small subunit ribosomal protein S1